MRKIVNKVRRDAEFHEMIDSLNSAHSSESKMAEGATEVFSPSLTLFAASMPGELSEGLKGIHASGKLQAQVSRDLVYALASLPEDLEILREYSRDIKRKTAETKAAEEQAARSEANLKVLEARGSREVDAKALSTVEMAREKMERDRQLADRAKSVNASGCEDLRRKFVSALAASLRGEAEKRARACARLAEISGEMGASVELLKDYEGGLVANLRERMEALESEFVE